LSIKLIQFDSGAKNSWVGQRDPRAKLGFALFILFGSIFANTYELLVLTILSLIIATLTLSVREVFQYLLNLKWFLILILVINLILTSGDLTSNTVVILLKFLGIVTAFVVFNRTTSPDEIVDSLIKLQIPATLAWSVGASIRQATFIIDELYHIRNIQRSRNNFYAIKPVAKLSQIITETYQMLISIYARAIIISNGYADGLSNRGWKKAHSTITLHTSQFQKNDLIFLISTIVIPLSMKLVIGSQLYIK
jgi:energy-coupling factor transporter transmembrane protein EcfT